jgi:hypothetical protein
MTTDNFIQAPVDGVGKKIQTVNETVAGNDVHRQIMEAKAYPAYQIILDTTTLAASRRHLTILNGAGSGKKIKILKAFVLNMQTAEIANQTAGYATFTWSRITARSGGSPATVNLVDTDNPAVPAQIVANSGDTAATADTAPNEYFNFVMSTYETANSFSTDEGRTLLQLQMLTNPLNTLASIGQQSVSIPEGKGLMIQQGSETVTSGKLRIVVIFELY